MASLPTEWIGSVYLFMHTDPNSLCAEYDTNKPLMYKTLWDALSVFSRNSNSPEILKVLKSDRHLILHLKFNGEDTCLGFLRDYRERRVHLHIQEQLSRCLGIESLQVFLELKVDNIKLDMFLDEEEKCLGHIYSCKPSYVKDEDLAELEENFINLSLGSSHSTQNSTSSTSPIGNSTPPLPLRSISSEPSTFHFQGQDYADKPLTSEHQQRFANLVGKSWKKVGRSLKKNCRALEDPKIDNLAYEYDKEGLYEQAYQLLRCFMDGEGRKATLNRLVDALVECELNVIAEKLLSLEEI
ncbi:tumor necrosis factor receptor type 1-associated DEATH domain protein isoform X2 [Rana temporaria]|nr:tumor necrosis factor receptor type 1-associated DEATH domain protein isoform X2 [Rana temporaria]XP_040185067.1 tumor necrosis factor receptor type 1-associated DEATH domain protein isoform X2 [Rana temporaria]